MFNPWSRKSPHARASQLLKPKCLKPTLYNKRSHLSEKSGHHNEEWPPLTATRESLSAATETQCRDFPGGPVPEKPRFQCRGLGLIPGQGTRPHRLQLRVCMLQLKISQSRCSAAKKKKRQESGGGMGSH